MKRVLPGATIGLLGGGQLGRMFTIAARKMGYRVHTFEPTPDSPSGQISDVEVNRPYTDVEALRAFAQNVEVVTYEFENIPVEALDALEGRVMLRPGRNVLHTTQNRRREKEFLNRCGYPVAPFRVVTSAQELVKAVEELGAPCVLKTADFGYDGRGQQKIYEVPDEKNAAFLWAKHGAPTGVLEKWITFEVELSAIVARTWRGESSVFPIGLNTHEHHILATSLVPAPLPPAITARAAEIARSIADSLELVGLLAVEFFLTPDGELLVNELAPRPHNSGHFSFDACVTSQFGQQLRAVCGLPLGDPKLLTPVLMRNLLGDLWARGNPDWIALLAIPGLKLHLYGKSEPRPGRKMGHYTIMAESTERALELDRRAQKILVP
ncbi:MAG: 5-(carboxyamino)imidazole ribonucleotide synthase [Candidatus Methylacidiphilales bacterium]|nr:5-(carboxyamino)imidazole ribonucleotide synthase [Candidatus Methylacidiphilales bacterium]